MVLWAPVWAEGPCHVLRLAVTVRCEARLSLRRIDRPEEDVEAVRVAPTHGSHERGKMVHDRPCFIIHQHHGGRPAVRLQDSNAFSQLAERDWPAQLSRIQRKKSVVCQLVVKCAITRSTEFRGRREFTNEITAAYMQHRTEPLPVSTRTDFSKWNNSRQDRIMGTIAQTRWP
eukprot:6179002-Pleurochrysis_carterae.AAC.5